MVLQPTLAVPEYSKKFANDQAKPKEEPKGQTSKPIKPSNSEKASKFSLKTKREIREKKKQKWRVYVEEQDKPYSLPLSTLQEMQFPNSVAPNLLRQQELLSCLAVHPLLTLVSLLINVSVLLGKLFDFQIIECLGIRLHQIEFNADYMNLVACNLIAYSCHLWDLWFRS